jgi:sigma-E factor negative regulatory protein RseB
VSASLAGRHLVGLAAAMGLLSGAAVLVGPGAALPPGKHRAGVTHAFAPSGRPAAPAAAMLLGTRLMAQAAAACSTTAFSGEQQVRWWGPAGMTTEDIDVWHQPGGQLVTSLATQPAGAVLGRPAGLAAADQDQMGLTRPQLALLQDNFVVAYAGRGSADGRPARIVQVWRPAGGLAATFWLDDVTGLPLRRELFSSGGLLSDTQFTSLRLGGGQPTTPQGAQGQPPQQGSARLGWPQVASLRSSGWPLPRLLPGSLVLVAASQLPSAQGTVVELTYSDGLSVISLFLQRGDLPDQLSNWHPATVGGRALYVSDADARILAWSAQGYVYSMIADAPHATVASTVAGLPRDRPDGLFDRIGRGLRRLVSWASPFH